MRTGEAQNTVHEYMDDYLIIRKWFWDMGYDQDLIGESVFAHAKAASMYDHEKGPWIAFLKLHIIGHMNYYLDYNSAIVHVPLLKRTRADLSDDDNLAEGRLPCVVSDGDKPLTGHTDVTLFDMIADDANVEYKELLTDIKLICEKMAKRLINSKSAFVIDLIRNYIEIKYTHNSRNDNVYHEICERHGKLSNNSLPTMKKVDEMFKYEFKRHDIVNPFR